MGWVRDAIKKLKAGGPAVVSPTDGTLRGIIDRGQVITIVPVAAEPVRPDDVVLVDWRRNPMLLVVKEARDDQSAVGDTVSPQLLGWVPRSAVYGKVTEITPLPAGSVRGERPRTIVFGMDTPDDYDPDTVLQSLGVSPLADHDEGGIAARVTFLPSFHPEVCITAREQPTPQVVPVTMQANLWHWACFERQRDNGTWQREMPHPNTPTRWEEVCNVSDARWQAFVAELQELKPAILASAATSGIDGMTVRGEYRDQAGACAFQPEDAPLLVDLGNLQAIATLLYPAFQPLLTRPGATVWLATGRTTSQLAAIGVENGRVFTDRDAALASLPPSR